MKMAAKSGARAKATVKPAKTVSKAATATKPVKKTVKKRTAAKTAKDTDEPKPTVVPLAEVEVLAAKAVKMIKAKRSVSAAKKARKLELVAETLEHARSMRGLSKCGAWGLKYPFGIMKVLDWKAVLR
jgi:hypothetical protein